MLKKVLIIIILSILIVVFGSYLHYLFTILLDIYHWLRSLLNEVFSQGIIAQTLSDTIALLVPAFFLGGLVTCIFWVLKRPASLAFIATVWGVWLLLIPLVYLKGSGTL